MRLSVALVSFAVLLAIATPAFPCSIAAPSEHTIDSTSTDKVAPTVTRTEVLAVARGQGPRDEGGCGSSSSSCDDIGWVRLGVQGADDTTPPAEMGWFFELESGALPQGMTLPATAVRATNGEVQLSFVDGAKDDQEKIECVLRVFAVDRAGNKSAPARVEVAHDGREMSCAIGMSRVRWGWAMPLVAFALMLRRRR